MILSLQLKPQWLPLSRIKRVQSTVLSVISQAFWCGHFSSLIFCLLLPLPVYFSHTYGSPLNLFSYFCLHHFKFPDMYFLLLCSLQIQLHCPLLVHFPLAPGQGQCLSYTWQSMHLHDQNLPHRADIRLSVSPLQGCELRRPYSVWYCQHLAQ